MMDKIDISLLGLGIIAATQLVGNLTHNRANDEMLTREEMQQQEFIIPGIALNEFVSDRYKVSFRYPKGWEKNPRYEDKYEGETGFFEIDAFEGVSGDIDETVKQEINEYYKPYGSNPTIRSFVVDGQPARVIYPSEDQSDFFKDRDAGIIIKYPEPITISGQKYDFVNIWVTKDYVPLILSTFKFIK